MERLATRDAAGESRAVVVREMEAHGVVVVQEAEAREAVVVRGVVPESVRSVEEDDEEGLCGRTGPSTW